MSTESLNRTSGETKTSNNNSDVLEFEKPSESKKKRTCINHLNQRLLDENRKDKNRNIFIACVIIFSVGLFGFLTT